MRAGSWCYMLPCRKSWLLDTLMLEHEAGTVRKKAHGRAEACDVVHSIGLDDQDTVGGSVPPHSCSRPAQRCSAPCLLRSQTESKRKVHGRRTTHCRARAPHSVGATECGARAFVMRLQGRGTLRHRDAARREHTIKPFVTRLTGTGLQQA